MLIFSILTSTAVIISIFMHTWVETHGAPQKRYGLTKVEIIGCGAVPKGSFTALVNGNGGINAAFEKIAGLGCTMLSTETQDGELTYSDYTIATCKEATSTQCVLAKTASIVDPTNWCRTL